MVHHFGTRRAEAVEQQAEGTHHALRPVAGQECRERVRRMLVYGRIEGVGHGQDPSFAASGRGFRNRMLRTSPSKAASLISRRPSTAGGILVRLYAPTRPYRPPPFPNRSRCL